MEPVEHLALIGFSHKSIGIEALGGLHIEEEFWEDRLSVLTESGLVAEVFLLSTCNRHEFYLVGNKPIQPKDIRVLLSLVYPAKSKEWTQKMANEAHLKTGSQAVDHLFHVSSSLDSAVLGEREIISQVRNAFSRCQTAKLTGELLRLLVKKTIETAKEVFTTTEIANRPVSIVNLAYRQLVERGLTENARILMVGAGKTNAAMARQLAKHHFQNLTIFNRTESKALQLAAETGGKGHHLNALAKYKEGFDVLITCTGSTNPIIDQNLYKALVQGEVGKKVVIDMAVPGDVEKAVINQNSITYIAIEDLKNIATKNLQTRSEEIDRCKVIIAEKLKEFGNLYKERNIEIAMRKVPTEVKEIKRRAMEEVFKNDLATLDAKSAEVVDKMIQYMEKKYMSLPMKMAKQILLEKSA